MNITLDGAPISVNKLYRGRRFLTKEGEAVKRSYFLQAKKQYRGALLTGPLCVNMRVYFRSKASSDIDNVCKATLDSLTKVLWNDDRQIEEMHVYKYQDKLRPRIEVEVTVDSVG